MIADPEYKMVLMKLAILSPKKRRTLKIALNASAMSIALS